MSPPYTSLTQLPLCIAILLTCGCGRYTEAPKPPVGRTVGDPGNSGSQTPQEHPHQAGMMGGVITSFAADRYHAEAMIDTEGILYVYVLGADETELHPVARQTVTAYLRHQSADRSTAIVLEPSPMDTAMDIVTAKDATSQTTRFAGKVPDQLLDSPIYVAVPGLAIEDRAYMLRFAISPQLSNHQATLSMPEPASRSEAEQLYLTAGGLYTESDIIANGQVTASDKYRNFRPNHDPNPQPGDLVCPITQTKANQDCSWIIGGQVYVFCCPPCIDEFLETAKASPGEVMPPEQYRK